MRRATSVASSQRCPLPKEELLTLKRSIAELGAIGRNLNQIARAVNSGERVSLPGRQELLAMLKIGEGLREHVKAFTEGQYGQLERKCRACTLILSENLCSTCAALVVHGPGRRDHLSPAELAVIARTVRRTPEVMVKVLTHGGQNLGAVGRHFNYIERGGELPIETDDGTTLKGKGVGKS